MTPVGKPVTPVSAADNVTRFGILPVVVIDDVSAARPVADALIRAGLSIVEITMRTPASLAALASIANDPDVLVGAGSVRSAAEADRAIEAGARFVVSPGIDCAVVERCRAVNVPALPGVATGSDLMAATGLGVTTVKFFPAAVLGGVRAVAALAAPFPELRFVPTGGVTAGDLPAYLAHPQVVAVGGSWIAPPQLIAERDWPAITAAAAATVATVAAIRP